MPCAARYSARRPPPLGRTHVGPWLRPPTRMFHEPLGQACGPARPASVCSPSHPGVTARPGAFRPRPPCPSGASSSWLSGPSFLLQGASWFPAFLSLQTDPWRLFPARVPHRTLAFRGCSAGHPPPRSPSRSPSPSPCSARDPRRHRAPGWGGESRRSWADVRDQGQGHSKSFGMASVATFRSSPRGLSGGGGACGALALGSGDHRPAAPGKA